MARPSRPGLPLIRLVRHPEIFSGVQSRFMNHDLVSVFSNQRIRRVAQRDSPGAFDCAPRTSRYAAVIAAVLFHVDAGPCDRRCEHLVPSGTVRADTNASEFVNIYL